MIITPQFIFLMILTFVLIGITWGLDARILGNFNLKPLRNVLAFVLVALIIGLCMLNFAATLLMLVVVCGIIFLIDQLFFYKQRKEIESEKPPLIVENARSFFWALLVVWVIRSFIIQPYRVPTGSLQPTIRPGDFLAVNQFAYGLRFPVTNTKLIPIGEPKRGDLVLFYAPPNPSLVFVKRVIGLPGDRIKYYNKVLYINGQEMKQIPLGVTIDEEPGMGDNPAQNFPVEEKQENLEGIYHDIFVLLGGNEYSGDFEVDVPEGHYFMMGDNRDNSDDSRMWGFVPEHYLIGKAFAVWMSWDSIHDRVRWNRIGKMVH